MAATKTKNVNKKPQRKKHHPKKVDAAGTKKRKVDMLTALRSTLGIVSTACRIAKTDRTTYYQWLEKDPKFKAEVEAISEEAIDFAETSLLQQIKKENNTATIFYLKTKGRKRGYIETSITVNREVDSLTDLSDEELNAIIAKGY